VKSSVASEQYKNSSSDCFNSRKPLMQHLKVRFSRFRVLLSSAETLVGRDGKINDLLIAYSLNNISVENYPNWFDVRQSYFATPV